MKNRWVVLSVLSVSMSLGTCFAQSQTAEAPQAAATPTAKPADVSSPDALIAAVYDVISGPAGKRDWERMKSLFYPGARLIRTAPKKEGGGFSAATFSVQDYIDRSGPYFEKSGFFEKEIARKADRWGNIMELFSTYESRHDQKDAQPFARGINSMQLFYDGTRWWMVTIYWQEESAETPLPAEYLPHAH